LLDQTSNTKLFRYLLLIILGWGLAQVLAYFSTVVIIFTLAAILAFLLNYPVRWVQRFLPRSIAVLCVFFVSLILLVSFTFTVGFAVISQGQELLTQLPNLVNSLISALEQIKVFLSQWDLQVDFSFVEEQLRGQALESIGLGLATVQKFLVSLIDIILIAIVAFFMLLNGDRLWAFLLKIFPPHRRSEFTESIQKSFLGFFWGRLILSIFFWISAFIVFLVLQIPYALTLATIVGVFDLIPGIGATLGVSMVALLVLPQGFSTVITVLVVCILLQQIQENLLMPRIMQGSLNINPVVMFFSLLVGARVAGLLGVFLAVPITGTIISLFKLGELQAEEPKVVQEEGESDS
jgi:predicted PurR-regulated permease PerM